MFFLKASGFKDFPTKNPPWGIETCVMVSSVTVVIAFPTKNPPWGIETKNHSHDKKNHKYRHIIRLVIQDLHWLVQVLRETVHIHPKKEGLGVP